MKAAIFDCFGHNRYDIRTKYIKEVFEEIGCTVDFYASDYDHAKKEYIINFRDGVNYVHVPAYEKNLSFARLYSHYRFSTTARKLAEKNHYDYIYCLVPANSIVNECGKYKEKNPDTKFIVDIFDMWPETFPSSKAKKLLALPFDVWRRFRDNRLVKADIVITECDLFKNKLKEINDAVNCKTLYPCKAQIVNNIEKRENKNGLDFAYLGSVNNIIDIDFIIEIMKSVKKFTDCRIHIIGVGEKYDEFVRLSKENGIETFAYGAVYDDKEKEHIFSECDFAFNIMKKDVFVGLTLKSIDYFSYRIPVINNIKADTWDLVDKEGIGINVSNESLAECVEKLANISSDEIYDMKQNIFKVYNELFSEEEFRNKAKMYIKK